ncbi:hypothetical protein Vretimale_4257 [Volvox reticuliferus]|uniref:Uncharacterized protein n=1 Tax=Volvox reticuliferus TaxID=1737510 RepID=A0A8J4DAH5_9CHLO|nr:hypothetical protein Vretifemale_2815 [Volvox reticuliferus]GIL98939.1 hypothetical protein Vretimale_4257 [Volvox reticuliferus]
MLTRTTLPAPSSQCSTSPSLRALPLALHQGRVLVVSKASYSARSSSPRSESWRSSWRTELEHGSNGNGNGAHLHHDDEYYTVYTNNSNGYHAEDVDSFASSWRSHAVDTVRQQELEASTDGGNGWGYSVSDSENVQHEESTSEESSAGGFFTDAFKEALKAALQRSPLYGSDLGGAASADEEVTEPQPYENEVEVYDRPIFNDQFRAVLKESLERQQAELDSYAGHGSDDEDPATPYVPSAPRPREMSPLEEVIATALGASQLHLRRLNLMKNEIEAAIERETKQVERLEFALSKAHSDIAYYKSLESMMAERKGRS